MSKYQLPSADCTDAGRWQRYIHQTLQLLSESTPLQLEVLLKPSSSNEGAHSKTEREDALRRFLAGVLNCSFEVRFPRSTYPNIIFDIKPSGSDTKLTVPVAIPRCLADFLQHEGRYTDTPRYTLRFGQDEIDLFQTRCQVFGVDPEDARKAIVDGWVDDLEFAPPTSSDVDALAQNGVYLDAVWAYVSNRKQHP